MLPITNSLVRRLLKKSCALAVGVQIDPEDCVQDAFELLVKHPPNSPEAAELFARTNLRQIVRALKDKQIRRRKGGYLEDDLTLVEKLPPTKTWDANPVNVILTKEAERQVLEFLYRNAEAAKVPPWAIEVRLSGATYASIGIRLDLREDAVRKRFDKLKRLVMRDLNRVAGQTAA